MPIGGRNWAMSSTSSTRPAARSTGSTATALASCTPRQPHARLRGPLLRAGAMAGLREGLQAAPRSRGLSQGAAPRPTCAARPRGRRTCRQPARRGELSPRSRVQPAAWGARRKGAAGAHEMEISSSQGVAATKSLRVTLAADAVTVGSSRLPMKRSAAGGARQESVGLRRNGWRGWGHGLAAFPAGFAAFRRAHFELSPISRSSTPIQGRERPAGSDVQKLEPSLHRPRAGALGTALRVRVRPESCPAPRAVGFSEDASSPEAGRTWRLNSSPGKQGRGRRWAGGREPRLEEHRTIVIF